MSKRISTIDDSKTMRDMLMLTLAEAGFDVLQAVDGQDGLDVLVNERVDVVITDIKCPGWTATKSSGNCAKIRIIRRRRFSC